MTPATTRPMQARRMAWVTMRPIAAICGLALALNRVDAQTVGPPVAQEAQGTHAAQGARGPRGVDPAVVARIVDAAAARVASSYAVLDTGRLIAEHVRRQMAAGRYADLRSYGQFSDSPHDAPTSKWRESSGSPATSDTWR